MLDLARDVVRVMDAGKALPQSFTDEAAVREWIHGLEEPVAALVVDIAKAVEEKKLGLLGSAGEAKGISPVWIELVIAVVRVIVEFLAKRRVG